MCSVWNSRTEGREEHVDATRLIVDMAKSPFKPPSKAKVDVLRAVSLEWVERPTDVFQRPSSTLIFNGHTMFQAITMDTPHSHLAEADDGRLDRT